MSLFAEIISSRCFLYKSLRAVGRIFFLYLHAEFFSTVWCLRGFLHVQPFSNYTTPTQCDLELTSDLAIPEYSIYFFQLFTGGFTKMFRVTVMLQCSFSAELQSFNRWFTTFSRTYWYTEEFIMGFRMVPWSGLDSAKQSQTMTLVGIRFFWQNVVLSFRPTCLLVLWP